MKKDDKIEWEFIVDRAYLPLSFSFAVHINNKRLLKKYIDIQDSSIDGVLFIPNDIFWTKGTLNEVADAQIKHHKKEGNKYLWEMAEICEERGDKLIKDLNDKITGRDIYNLSKEEVLNIFEWAVGELKDFSLFLTIPLSLESYLDEQMQSIVKPVVDKDSAQKIIAKLLLPLKINESSKENIELLKLSLIACNDKDIKNILLGNKNNIVSSLETGHENFLKSIDEFIKKYGWVHTRWLKGNPVTRKDVLNRISEALKGNPEEKLKESQEYREKVLKFVNDFVDKYNLSDVQKDTIMLIKEYVFIRTYRTDTLNMAFGIITPLLKRVAEVLELSIDDILYHSESELIDKLKGGNVNVDISARKKNWAIMRIGDNDYRVYTGEDEVNTLIREQGISRGVDNVEKITGNSAFKGKAKGTVKIVLEPGDVEKVEKGDVLVAVMTFPSYIAAMERSSAFITDEGGILCHASIIAREMKKPCIIATKIATKVLKDGDEVEVDADNGVVRVIKK